MWQYMGLDDPTRCLAADITGSALLFWVQQVSKCSDTDLDSPVSPYGADVPLPEVLLFF